MTLVSWGEGARASLKWKAEVFKPQQTCGRAQKTEDGTSECPFSHSFPIRSFVPFFLCSANTFVTQEALFLLVGHLCSPTVSNVINLHNLMIISLLETTKWNVSFFDVSICPAVASCDRIVISILRCGHSDPGSNLGHANGLVFFPSY